MVIDGPPPPDVPKSSLLPLAPLRYICPFPPAVLFALVETNCPVTVPPAIGNLVESATVMLEVPSKDTLLIVLAVCNLVAEEALPVIVPVTVTLPVAVRSVVVILDFGFNDVLTEPTLDVMLSGLLTTMPF